MYVTANEIILYIRAYVHCTRKNRNWYTQWEKQYTKVLFSDTVILI